VTVLQAVIMLLVALGGASVTLTRDPLRQVIVSGFYGLTLVVLFLVFQAPDVALSAVVVGSIGLPLMVLLALAKVRSRERRDE
jgi:energy-converting hydrogenase B subunit D